MEHHETVYIGISAPPIDFESADLTCGARLVKCYANVFAPFMLSYTPASNTARFGEPWTAVQGGLDFKINAQVSFSFVKKSKLSENDQIVHFSSLLKISISPEILCPLIATAPFSNAEEASSKECRYSILDTDKVYHPFKQGAANILTINHLSWMRDHWYQSIIFAGECKPYRLAIEVLGKVSNFHSRGMALVAVCGVLESFYLQNKTELSFRLALYIAAYLGRGQSSDLKLKYFKTAKSVYAARSSSAHSSEDCDAQPLLDAIQLLRLSIWSALAQKRLPKAHELDDLLLAPDKESEGQM